MMRKRKAAAARRRPVITQRQMKLVERALQKIHAVHEVDLRESARTHYQRGVTVGRRGLLLQLREILAPFLTALEMTALPRRDLP